MKNRLLMFVLVFILACSVSFADEIDISGLDLKELEVLQSKVSARIVELKAADGIDENLIYEGKGIKLYMQGKPTQDKGSSVVHIKFVIENNTDKTLTFFARGIGINDYSLMAHDTGEALAYDLPKGMKHIGDLSFFVDQFNGKSANDVSSIKFWVHGFDDDFNTFVETDYVETVYK